jgi:hypothetical protein
MKQIILLLAAILLFFGCAQLPDAKACYATMGFIKPTQGQTQSRVYILKPHRSFGQSLSLFGTYKNNILLRAKTDILAEDMQTVIAQIDEGEIVYFDAPAKDYVLYARNQSQKDDVNATEASKIEFTATGQNVFLIVKNRTSLGTVMFADYYVNYLESIDMPTMSKEIEESCDNIKKMRYKQISLPKSL